MSQYYETQIILIKFKFFRGITITRLFNKLNSCKLERMRKRIDEIVLDFRTIEHFNTDGNHLLVDVRISNEIIFKHYILKVVCTHYVCKYNLVLRFQYSFEFQLISNNQFMGYILVLVQIVAQVLINSQLVFRMHQFILVEPETITLSTHYCS